jgi:Flp pilus assembly protein TadG
MNAKTVTKVAIMRRSRSRFASNRGAVLVHVAVTLLVVISMSTIAVDFGLFWLSRSEAQNAADGAALAGAVALAYDSPSTASDGPAKKSALAIAGRHRVWGAKPATDVTFPVCPDGTTTCIRVDAYRDLAHGNPLPMLFGGLVGVANQGVRATATAQSRVATASRCLKPWIIPDKWEEHYPTNPGTWNADTSTFDTSTDKGKPLANPDQYRSPTSGNSMTGFRASGPNNDIGLSLTLKAPDHKSGGLTGPGWMYIVQLDEDTNGGSEYKEDIQTCTNKVIKIGDLLRNETGVKNGPTTTHGVDLLIAADPAAHWVDPDGPGGSPGRVAGSCMETASCPSPYSPSPTRSARLIDVAVFNPAKLDGKSGHFSLEVVNILGFFLLPPQGKEIRGVITRFSGVATQGGGLPEHAAFSHTVLLVR